MAEDILYSECDNRQWAKILDTGGKMFCELSYNSGTNTIAEYEMSISELKILKLNEINDRYTADVNSNATKYNIYLANKSLGVTTKDDDVAAAEIAIKITNSKIELETKTNLVNAATTKEQIENIKYEPKGD